jgi:hypothetical protein
VEARLVSALNPRARRSDVAKTIYYRRRKGTMMVLEQLADDMAGWDARLVEQFRRLARMRHGLDGPAVAGRVTTTPEGGMADLRSVRGALLTGGPFDEFHYTPETRRPQDRLGLRGIQTVAFHLHRLSIVELRGVTPRRVNNIAATTRDGFSFDPSGRSVPLFASGADRGDWSGWTPASEGSLPVAIDCRLFNERIFAVGDPAIAWVLAAAPIPSLPQRQAAAADLRRIAGQRFASEAVLRRVLAGQPSGAILAGAAVMTGILARSVAPYSGSEQLAGVVGVDVAPAVTPASAMRAADLSAWPVPSPPGIALLFDPASGRFLFDPGAAAPDTLSCAYAIGMTAPVGAGAPGRSVGSAAATANWANRVMPGGVPAAGVLQLDDSSSFAAPANRLTITDLEIRAAEGQRPYVALNANWRLGASGSNRSLVIDGLWIGGSAGQLRLEGDWARVVLRFCTLDPGGRDTMGAAIPPVGLLVAGTIDELVIERSILPGIRLAGANAGVDRLVLSDSIVDASVAAAAGGILLPRSLAEIRRSTLLGSGLASLVLDVEQLDASDTLIAGTADVTNLQAGCFRFSARGPASRVPHPYESHEITDLERLFRSRRFGDPHYLDLSPRVPETLLRGSQDGAEIGVLAGERRPIRADGLMTKIEEYLPFGRLPALIMEN